MQKEDIMKDVLISKMKEKGYEIPTGNFTDDQVRAMYLASTLLTPEQFDSAKFDAAMTREEIQKRTSSTLVNATLTNVEKKFGRA